MMLKHFRPAQTGCYVDVGAYHPWRDSNTFKLYLLGWRGVTIEPNPDAADAFRRARPGDTHLTMGVAATRSELVYRRYADAKLNSFDSAQSSRMDNPSIGEELVTCAPLSEIIAQHCPGKRVDLLSIDCEGLDQTVLQSIDWESCRPTVLIVEDFDQFTVTFRQSSDKARDGGQMSGMRQYLVDRDYCLASQNLFSFIYVDRRAFGDDGRSSGFRLSASQLAGNAARD